VRKGNAAFKDLPRNNFPSEASFNPLIEAASATLANP